MYHNVSGIYAVPEAETLLMALADTEQELTTHSLLFRGYKKYIMKFSNSDQFYPTPPYLCRRFFEDYKSDRFEGFYTLPNDGKYVLDPSAGRGDLLEPLQGSRFNLYGFEIDGELASILRDKKVRLLGEDFLEYEGKRLFDLVVMNPPFRNGVDHVIHAWELVAPGGDLVCILNATAVSGKGGSNHRVLMDLVDKFSYTPPEIIEGAFKDADRKTDVDVVLIKLRKPKQEDMFTLKNRTKITIEAVPEDDNGVAKFNHIASTVDAYNHAVELFKAADAAVSKFYNAAQFFMKGHTEVSPRELLGNGDLNEFLDTFSAMAWDTLFNRLDIEEVLTKSVRTEFAKFKSGQVDAEFTRSNIHNLLDTLYLKVAELKEQSLLDVFDKMCNHSPKNRTYLVDGFKTNSAYRINEKVILPHMADWDKYLDRISLHYDTYLILNDIDRVLCTLVGLPFDRDDEGNLHEVIETACKAKEFTCKSRFFDIKLFKKGTIHLKFTYMFKPFDADPVNIVTLLNRRVAEIRNWLPEDINN